MSKRPEHATDCPGCETGWTASGLLCSLCESAVNTGQPDLFPEWMKRRARHTALLQDNDVKPVNPYLINSEACAEHFYRGVIIGTARVLSAARAAQHASWRRKKS